MWEETVAHSDCLCFNGAISVARRHKVKQSMSWMVTVLHNASVLIDVMKGGELDPDDLLCYRLTEIMSSNNHLTPFPKRFL